MPIEFSCSQCGAPLCAPDARTETIVRCHECATVAPVPPASAPEEALPQAVLVEADAPAPKSVGIVGAPHARTGRPAPKRRKWPLRYKVGAWLGGAVALLALLLGVGYAMLPGEEWHRHESAAGGFAIDAPCPLRPDFTLPGVPADPNLKTEGNTLLKRGLACAVVHGEIAPPEQRQTDAFLLKTAADELRNDPETRALVREDPITVSGFRGVELEYVYSDGGTYVGRVVVAHRRLYLVVASGRFARPGNANVRRFLDSFEITDDTLVGGTAHARKVEAEQRAAAEAKAREEARLKAANEAFRNAPYTGPVPCDPCALVRKPSELLRVRFDCEHPNGAGAWGPHAPIIPEAVTGTGPRGAAYVNGKSRPTEPLTIVGTSSELLDVPRGKNGGTTLSIWYKARFCDAYLLTLTESSARQSPTKLELVARKDKLVVSVSGRSGRQEVSAPRPQDDAWHHVAVVYEARTGSPQATLFADGVEVARGTVSHLNLDQATLGFSGWGGRGWDAGHTPAASEYRCAFSDCCLFDLPLGTDDVRRLAGRLPAPPADEPKALSVAPFPIPDPTAIAGLTHHFPFDELECLYSRERLAGVVCARGSLPEPAPGQRGRAVRAQLGDTFFPSLVLLAPKTGSSVQPIIGQREQFTVAFWIHLPQSATQPDALFFSHGDRGDPSLRLFRDAKTGALSLRSFGGANKVEPETLQPLVPQGGTNKVETHTLQAMVPQGEWVHVALLRSADGTLSVATNGKLEKTPIGHGIVFAPKWFGLASQDFERGKRSEWDSTNCVCLTAR